jgi:hypothetical protein
MKTYILLGLSWTGFAMSWKINDSELEYMWSPRLI